MTAIFLAVSAGGSERVTVSGETISATALSPTDAIAGVSFQNDGTVDSLINSVSNQIDVGTDWVRPAGAAPSSYEIRLTVSSGLAPNVPFSAPIDTWLALTTSRNWELERIGAGTNSGTWLIEIRRGSGPVLASGSYIISAEVT